MSNSSLKSNREVLFLVSLFLFSIFCRIIPLEAITLLFVLLIIAAIAYNFYFYTNKIAKKENKNENVTEFSWGYVAEKTNLLDLKTFIKYLSNKDYFFFKNYIKLNFNKIILSIFIFGDLIVAFKNLSFFYTGIFIAMSIFTKFVFLGYMFMQNTYSKPDKGELKEEQILEIFYTQMNGLISLFTVLFIMFFILSKYMVEIFFGSSFLPYQASLPFIMLANMCMVISLCVFTTALKINKINTERILKMHCAFFAVIFIFMSINYIDTVTYFVIGASCILSIFLYNFVIKKPEYILNTYNHLF